MKEPCFSALVPNLGSAVGLSNRQHAHEGINFLTAKEWYTLSKELCLSIQSRNHFL
jgi:hypothetical protein